MAIELAKAYVQVVPTTDGIKGTLTSALDGASTSAGSSASGKFASAFSAGLKGTAVVTAAVAGAIAAGSSAVINATGELAEYGDTVDKTSQKLGVSSKFYQEWDAVLQHSGTSMESMTTTFRTLANASQDATADQAAAFDAIGLSMQEVSSMSTEDLFEAVITGLQQMEEGTERTAIATDLLGRGAMEMGALLNTSAEETQSMIDTVNELGGVLDDSVIANSALFQDNLQDMQTAFAGLKNSLLSDFLPGMNQVMSGLTAFISGDEGGLSAISGGIQETVTKMGENIPQLLDVAVNIIEGLADAIIQNLPALTNTAVEVIGELGGYIIDNLPLLIETALQIVLSLAEGLAEALPELVPAIVDVVLQIVDTLLNNVDLLVDAAVALVMGLAEGIINAMPILIEKMPDVIISIVNALVDNIPMLLEVAVQLMMTFAEGMITNLPTIISKIPQIIKGVVDGFAKYYDNMLDVGANLLLGLWEGIASKFAWIKEQVASVGQGILDTITSVFDIHSPSRQMMWVGQMLDEGLAEGISAYAGDVTGEITGISDEITAEMSGLNTNLNKQLKADYSINGSIATDKSQGVSLNDLMALLGTYLPQIAEKDLTIDGRVVSEKVWSETKKVYKATGVNPALT